MKVVMAEAPEVFLAQRRRNGADQWDEMWEGVLHMPPAPNRDHQDLEWALETWLREFWSPTSGGRVYHQINVASPGGWPNDYRIPDLVLLTPDRFFIDKNDYFDGAPAVVVEIRSPHNETFEKFAFYARLQVPEIWVIDRESRTPQVHVLCGEHYESQELRPDGWLASPTTKVVLKGAAPNRLGLQLADDRSTWRLIP